MSGKKKRERARGWLRFTLTGVIPARGTCAILVPLRSARKSIVDVAVDKPEVAPKLHGLAYRYPWACGNHGDRIGQAVVSAAAGRESRPLRPKNTVRRLDAPLLCLRKTSRPGPAGQLVLMSGEIVSGQW